MKRAGLLARVASRGLTLLELTQHLLRRKRYFLLPLLLVLLLAGALLLATEGLSYVAPFVYTLF